MCVFYAVEPLEASPVERHRQTAVEHLRSLVYVQHIDLISLKRKNVDELYVNLSILSYTEAETLLGNRQGMTMSRMDYAAQKGLAESADGSVELQDLKMLLRSQDCMPQKMALVIGGGGSGKTITCRKILSEWLYRRGFRQFKLVVLLSGRDKEIMQSKDEAELLELGRAYSAAEKEAVTCHWEKHSRDVLFLIDGAEEVGEKGLLGQGKAIRRLLNKKIFTLSSIIIFTRPSPQAQTLLSLCSGAQFCLIGFTEERLKELADRTLGLSLASAFMAKFEPAQMLYIKALIEDTPLYASMVMQLFEKDQGNLPDAITDIFRQMLDRIIQRLKQKTALDNPTDAASRLPEKYEVTDLERLAYDGMLKQEFTFDEERVQASQDNLQLGLLYEVTPDKRLFTFYHLFWQEFLAARYLSSLPTLEITGALNQCVSSVGIGEHTWQFWKFVTAHLPPCLVPDLVFQLNKGILISLGVFESNSTKVKCFLVSCVAEAFIFQNLTEGMEAIAEMAAQIIWAGEELYLSNHALLPLECKSVNTVFRFCPSRTFIIIEQCTLSEECWKLLVDGLGDTKGINIQRVGNITERCMRAIVANNQASAPKLVFSDSPMDEEAAVLFLRATSERNYEALTVKSSGISCNVLSKLLLEFSPQWNYLEMLDFSGNNLGGCAQVFQGLFEYMPLLERVEFEDCNLKNQEAEALLEALRTRVDLKCLNLQLNSLTEGLASALLQFVCVRRQCGFSSQQGVVEIRFSNIDSLMAACYLTVRPSMVPDSDTVLKFYDKIISAKIVGQKNFTAELSIREAVAREEDFAGHFHVIVDSNDEETCQLAEFLEKDKNVVFLDDYNGFITNKGAFAISGMLHFNSTLQALGLSANKISHEGFQALCNKLNEHLLVLNLGNNPIFAGATQQSLSSAKVNTDASLQVLCLSQTGMTNQSLREWSRPLLRGLRLSTLDLSRNLISDHGLKFLTEQIHQHIRLESLSLSRNCITEQGAQALLQKIRSVFQSRPPPLRIAIGGNPIADSFFSANRNSCQFLLAVDWTLTEYKIEFLLENFIAGQQGYSNAAERAGNDRLWRYVNKVCLSGDSLLNMLATFAEEDQHQLMKDWMDRCLEAYKLESKRTAAMRSMMIKLLQKSARRCAENGATQTAAELYCENLLILAELRAFGKMPTSLDDSLQETLINLNNIASQLTDTLPGIVAGLCRQFNQAEVSHQLLEDCAYFCDPEDVWKCM